MNNIIASSPTRIEHSVRVIHIIMDVGMAAFITVYRVTVATLF